MKRIFRSLFKVVLLLSISTAVYGDAISPCDLDASGSVNVLDYVVLFNMYSGKSGFTCTANIDGPNVCDIVGAGRIIDATLGRGCLLSNGSHYVTLSWDASTSIVSGYNIYRGTTSGGPYIQINSSLISGLSFFDSTVTAGCVCYYVATAVDSSSAESAYSNEATAVVPSP